MAKPKKSTPQQSQARGSSRNTDTELIATESTSSRRFRKHEFYSYLMLAIRACGRDSFDAEGPLFYEAFLKAVERARVDCRHLVDGLQSMTRDPVFGVVHQANEMLLEAEEDRIIALLNPQLREAHFKISKAQAEKELAEAGDEQWFKALALEFIQATGHKASPEATDSSTN